MCQVRSRLTKERISFFIFSDSCKNGFLLKFKTSNRDHLYLVLMFFSDNHSITHLKENAKALFG